MMVISIFSISDHMGDAVYMELALLPAFALFRSLLGHLSMVPGLRSRIRDEALPQTCAITVMFVCPE